MVRIAIHDPIPPPTHRETAARVEVRHPGYRDQNNIIFSLPAVDAAVGGPAGLLYHFVHAACSVIADNAFHGYLSRSALARNNNESELVDNDSEADPLLTPGTYYFHVPRNRNREEELVNTTPQPTVSLGHDALSHVVGDRSSAPLTGPIMSGSEQRPISLGPSSQWPDLLPYPVVALPSHWTFPHEAVPKIWCDLERENGLVNSNTLKATCALTRHVSALDASHIVSQSGTMIGWFAANNMDRYTNEPRTGKGINDRANMVNLRKDVHWCWDQNSLSFVPKLNEKGQPVLVAHALRANPDIMSELHNRPLQQEQHKYFSRFFFARFALQMIAQQMPAFYKSQARRRTVCARADGAGCYVVFMDSADFAQEAKRIRDQSPTKRKATEQSYRGEDANMDSVGDAGSDATCSQPGSPWNDSGVSDVLDSPKHASISQHCRGRKRRRSLDFDLYDLTRAELGIL